MGYVKPTINTVAAREIVEKIGPATAMSSGASPRTKPFSSVIDDGGFVDSQR